MLAEVMMRIQEMPELGSPWESNVPTLQGLRFRIPRRFKNHVVFYRVTDDCIDIVRVLHGSRDLEKRLQEFDE
jgi:plasmid stabilization system protein ParE